MGDDIAKKKGLGQHDRVQYMDSVSAGAESTRDASHASVLGGSVMQRHERSSVSRVREIRTHGLNGGLASSCFSFTEKD
jgi:hypothetical protein